MGMALEVVMGSSKPVPTEETLFYKLSMARDEHGEPMFDPLDAKQISSFHDLARNALRFLKNKNGCWCGIPSGTPSQKGHVMGCALALSAIACLDDED